MGLFRRKVGKHLKEEKNNKRKSEKENGFEFDYGEKGRFCQKHLLSPAE